MMTKHANCRRTATAGLLTQRGRRLNPLVPMSPDGDNGDAIARQCSAAGAARDAVTAPRNFAPDLAHWEIYNVIGNADHPLPRVVIVERKTGHAQATGFHGASGGPMRMFQRSS